jgi:hypothetical protein
VVAGIWLLGVPAWAQQGQPDINALLQNLMNANQTEGPPPELIDFRDLKAGLPEALPGMKRTEAKGERTGAMGMNVSMAEGVYVSEEGARITVKYTDMGGMQGMAAMARMGWAAAQIDRETEDEREYTTKIGEYKAHYRYNTKRRGGEIQVMAGERMMVEVQGARCSAEQLQAAIDAVPLKKVAVLQPKPAEETPAAAEAGSAG